MIIVERELYRIHKDGKLSKIAVSFGQPRRVIETHDKEESWACSFQIIGLDRTITQETPGLDSLEALLNAFIMAGEYLERFSAGADPLMWNGLPGLGFPKFDEQELQKNLAFATRS